MSFGAQLRAYAKKQNLRVENVAAAAILETSTKVIKRTPVDTGRLRGNWQTSVETIPSGTLERADKSGAASLSEAQAGSFSAFGKVFYLVNNLPYARVAEYGEWKGEGEKITSEGFSKQAPAGMVRLSVNEFNTALAKALRSN